MAAVPAAIGHWLPARDGHRVGGPAIWAEPAFGPALSLEPRLGSYIVGEHSQQLHDHHACAVGASGCLLCHTSLQSWLA